MRARTIVVAMVIVALGSAPAQGQTLSGKQVGPESAFRASVNRAGKAAASEQAHARQGPQWRQPPQAKTPPMSPALVVVMVGGIIVLVLTVMNALRS